VRLIYVNVQKAARVRGSLRANGMELLMAIGKICSLAAAAGIGALLIGEASAAPTNGLSAAVSQVTSNVQHVRWVCGPYRCWWATGPYYGYYAAPTYYGYYAAPYYGYYAYAGPGWGYGWRRWWW
jgi:hypothetical protein